MEEDEQATLEAAGLARVESMARGASAPGYHGGGSFRSTSSQKDGPPGGAGQVTRRVLRGELTAAQRRDKRLRS